MTSATGVKVLAVADSDSYLKWAAQTLDEMPASWQRHMHVLRTAVTPSDSQIADALHGTVLEDETPPVTGIGRLLATVAATRPDILFLSGTGPFVEALGAVLAHVAVPRPLVVTGLPGMSVPATRKALQYRRDADLFIVHSEREVREFGLLAQELGIDTRITLNTLPFLHKAPARSATPPDRPTVVFATQAKVPVRRNDRVRILTSLADLARSRPDLRVVVKLRARMSEQQTHVERHHYESLYNDLLLDGSLEPGLLHFETGAMATQLETAAALVTVSSTAALESVAADVPTLLLSDFGVNANLLNLVFRDSGMLGTLADLRAGRFPHPTDEWKRANYFHTPGENDWIGAIEELLEARHGGNVRNVAALGSPATIRALGRLSGPSPVARKLRAAGRRLGMGSVTPPEPATTARPVQMDISGHNHEISVADTADLTDSSITVSGEGCRVVIGSNVTGRLQITVADGGSVAIGQGSTIEKATIISRGASIEIGSDCMFSFGVEIRNTDTHAIYDLTGGERINPDLPVSIGRHVWMGKQAMVLKGADVGDGSIIGARAVVTGQIPPNSSAAGIPARVIRRDIAWARTLGEDTFGLDFRTPEPETVVSDDDADAEAVLAGVDSLDTEEDIVIDLERAAAAEAAAEAAQAEVDAAAAREARARTS
jgi:acetyltransferase-like isoleucine patch superfamily enzyme